MLHAAEPESFANGATTHKRLMSAPICLYAMTRDPANPRHKILRRVRDLGEAEVQMLKTGAERLNNFESWDTLMRILAANQLAYSQAVQECRTSAHAAYRRGQFRSLVDLTINRALANFVSTFRLYLDHTKTRIEHRYGSSSASLLEFRAATSTAFDRSFAYRFVYQARDYTVHCGLPIVHASMQGAVDENGNPEHHLSYHLDAQHLLRTGPSYWRGKVKQDLEARDTPIDVEPIIVQAMVEITEVHRRCIEAEKQLLHEAGRAIMHILQEAFSAESVPVVARPPTEAENPAFTMEEIPFVMLERLGYIELPESE
jgi:hypothetical protein